jgi:hypothetical protein
MTRIASHLFRPLAITAVLTVGLCSMVMNWRIGHQLGSTPIKGANGAIFGERWRKCALVVAPAAPRRLSFQPA